MSLPKSLLRTCKELFKGSFFFGCLLLASGCYDQNADSEELNMLIPDDNQMSPERVALGKRLFNDHILSPDSTIACISCHKPQFAFADNVAISNGNFNHKGFRNSPTLVNVGYQEVFFSEAGIKTLEQAVVPPMMDEQEMGQDLRITLNRLNSNAQYRDLFKSAYGTDTIQHRQLVNAIAAYIRSLTDFSSRWDQFVKGNIQDERLANGQAIFNRMNCNSCHIPPLFFDNLTHNIGLEDGVPEYRDWGRGRLTLDSADFGAFKTPSLRNLGVTAPYMHDGRFKTLIEVIRFYESGGQNNPSKSSLIKARKLSDEDRSDLEYFLQSLNGEQFSE